MKIRGRVKIYTRKQVKKGKKYTFRQAIIIIPSTFLSQIKKYDGKEVEIEIIKEGE